ncbi:MAG: hypothetical protein GY796_01535 [Chloroflexi bacterium]|nr:hypothetical protein [Chloroflexota bacterium]
MVKEMMDLVRKQARNIPSIFKKPSKRLINEWRRDVKYLFLLSPHLHDTFLFSYEQFTNNTEDTIQNILNFLPEIGSVNIGAKFSAHNITGESIQGVKNLNQQKINKLSQRQIREINGVLCQHEDLLQRFQYQLID